MGKRRKRLIAVAAAIVGMYAGWLIVSTMLVSAADASAPRNDESAVMTGSETFQLGSPDAALAVLFVHGFVGGTDNFADLPQRVADSDAFVRVIRLPGHGTTPKDLRSVTADTLQSAVAEELRGLKQRHERVILVGHSMGGALSTLAVSELGADGLVLGGAYFGVTHRWYYGFRPETWTRVSTRVLPWVYKGKLFIQVNDKSAKEHITSYTWIPAKAAVTLSEIGERVNDPQVLQKVTCPVLMLHAQGDIAASPEASERAFNAMASTDKKLVWLERSNHHVFWDYDRELVATEVLAFIKRIADGPKLAATE